RARRRTGGNREPAADIARVRRVPARTGAALRRAAGAERGDRRRFGWVGRPVTDGARGTGTADDPWELTTPPGKAGYQMWKDEQADPPALVCQVGATQLRYHLRAIDDLHAMLKGHGD